MNDPPPNPLEYASPPSRSVSTVLALAGLWIAFVVGILFETFLYSQVLHGVIVSGTTGPLLRSDQVPVVRMILVVIGIGLLALLYACVRFTLRFCRGRHQQP